MILFKRIGKLIILLTIAKHIKTFFFFDIIIVNANLLLQPFKHQTNLLFKGL